MQKDSWDYFATTARSAGTEGRTLIPASGGCSAIPIIRIGVLFGKQRGSGIQKKEREPIGNESFM